jgi:hypothetical protein
VSNNLKSEWLHHCLRLAARPSKEWPHERKILRNERMTFELDDSLHLADVNYTDLKMKALIRLYVHTESRDAALERWNERRKGKYTSVGLHTCNHLSKISGRVGTQGPCMLSLVVTDTGPEMDAHIAYRSTEFFKKFPADLVFVRDVLLQSFGVTVVTFHFANVTVHPLYFPILFPLLDDPVAELRTLREKDERFWRVVVREATDLLCGGKRNANFMQAQRVAKSVLDRIDPTTLNELRGYLRSAS